MVAWSPTHEIALDSGKRVQVMLVDGVGYTRSEWENESPADYERTEEGWFFQGQPFAGYVLAMDRCAHCGADLTESLRRLRDLYPGDPDPAPFCDDDCAAAWEVA